MTQSISQPNPALWRNASIVSSIATVTLVAAAAALYFNMPGALQTLPGASYYAYGAGALAGASFMMTAVFYTKMQKAKEDEETILKVYGDDSPSPQPTQRSPKDSTPTRNGPAGPTHKGRGHKVSGHTDTESTHVRRNDRASKEPESTRQSDKGKQPADVETSALSLPTVSVETIHTGALLKPQIAVIENFDPVAFYHFILEFKDKKNKDGRFLLSRNKEALFKNTLLTLLEHMEGLNGKRIEIPYYRMAPQSSDFDNLLTLPFQNGDATFGTTPKWFDYSDKNHTYIDFANANTFGGGWRTRGMVQEETMFFEFIQLALLAFATQNNPIHPTTVNPKNETAEPTPFVIPNLQRNFKLNPKTYGRGLDRSINIANIPDMVEKADSPPIVITGIAARKWDEEDRGKRRYSHTDLIYHLKAAYLTFMAEKELNPDSPRVHTAPWGCGAFNNSEMMINAIQLLAARMAGVHLVFYGIGNQHNPNYDDQTLDYLNRKIQEQPTPEACLNEFLDLQKLTPALWEPKKS